MLSAFAVGIAMKVVDSNIDRDVALLISILYLIFLIFFLLFSKLEKIVFKYIQDIALFVKHHRRNVALSTSVVQSCS